MEMLTPTAVKIQPAAGRRMRRQTARQAPRPRGMKPETQAKCAAQQRPPPPGRRNPTATKHAFRKDKPPLRPLLEFALAQAINQAGRKQGADDGKNRKMRLDLTPPAKSQEAGEQTGQSTNRQTSAGGT